MLVCQRYQHICYASSAGAVCALVYARCCCLQPNHVARIRGLLWLHIRRAICYTRRQCAEAPLFVRMNQNASAKAQTPERVAAMLPPQQASARTATRHQSCRKRGTQQRAAQAEKVAWRSSASARRSYTAVRRVPRPRGASAHYASCRQQCERTMRRPRDPRQTQRAAHPPRLGIPKLTAAEVTRARCRCVATTPAFALRAYAFDNAAYTTCCARCRHTIQRSITMARQDDVTRV